VAEKKPHKAKPTHKNRKFYRNLVGRKAGNPSYYMLRKQRREGPTGPSPAFEVRLSGVPCRWTGRALKLPGGTKLQARRRTSPSPSTSRCGARRKRLSA